MAEQRIQVKQGECVSSIAESRGLFWETVWNANSALKRKRKNPNALLAGDELVVPEKRPKHEERSTGAKHRFKRKGVPAMLRLIVERDHTPIRDARYLLIVDGTSYEGTTDGSGYLERAISPLAEKARLEVDDLVYEFTFGAMDPLEEISGIQARLQNLGFYDGPIDGALGPETKQALAEFQAFSGLECSGELGDATRSALEARHDQPHEAVEQQAAASAEEPDEAGADQIIESQVGADSDESEEFAEFEHEIPKDASDA